MPSELALYPRDGSLWDGVVRGATWADWETFLKVVRTEWENRASFQTGGAAHPIPDSADALAAVTRTGPVLLALDVDGVRIHFHCDAMPELEFDVDPREVTERTEPALRSFLVRLARALGKAVEICPEGSSIVMERFAP